MTAKAYSYTRFSTPEEAKGHSLRRQLERSEAFAKQLGLPLDDSLRDLGLSAYSGAHRKKGALGAFLDKIKSGEVPRGSVLIVESLDRLSRERLIDAQQQFLDIIRAGVKVVTLIDQQMYDEVSLSTNMGQLFTSLVIMMRAYEESQTKSNRLRDASIRRRKEATSGGKKFVKHPPAWLRLAADDESFEVIPEAAEVIRQIYKWKASGDGTKRIVRRLNAAKGWRPIGRRYSKKDDSDERRKAASWHPGYIEKLLKWRAVLGEWQPHEQRDGRRVPIGDPVPNYFPPIIQPALFDRVQAIIARNRQIPGHAGGAGADKRTVGNVFGNILRCGHCGGRVKHKNNGPSRNGHGGGEYVYCYRSSTGSQCRSTWRLRYDHLEPLLLHLVKGLNAANLLISEDEVSTRRATLLRHVQEADGALEQVRKQVDHLTDAIADESDKALREVLKSKLSKLLEKQRELEGRKAALATEISARANTTEAIASQIRDTQDLIKRMAKLKIENKIEERSDIRRRLRHQLQQLIDRIEIKSIRGHKTALNVYFCGGGESGLTLDRSGKLRAGHEDGRVYWLDESGNVVDVAARDEDAQLEIERANAKANERIARALKKHGLPGEPHIKAKR